MGWLWACLGGGPTSKEQRHCSKHFIHHQSKGRLRSSPSDHLRFCKAREGYGSLDHYPQVGARLTSSMCSGPRKVDVSRRSKSSNATMKIHFEGNFDAETSLQSDVEEMKEELATLRQILVAEADQARELREEVNYLRSCGVLHKNFETNGSDTNEDPASPEGWGMMLCQNEGNNVSSKKHLSERDSSFKELRKCQSGPMHWSASANFSNFTNCSPVMSLAAAERTAKCMQSDHKRLSAQRAALFPRLQLCPQDVQDCQDDDAGMLSDGNEEGATDLHGRSCPRILATNGTQISLTEVVSFENNANYWEKPVSDMGDATMKQGRHEANDLESSEGESGAEALELVQWMGVQRSPISSSSSSNVKDKSKFTSKLLECIVGADGVIMYTQRTGKRQQNRSGDQAEKWPEEQSVTVRSLDHCEVADSQVFKCSEVKKEGELNLEEGHCVFLDSIDLEPIQCASPTLSQKRGASIATISLSTLPVSLSLTPDLQEFDKMEIGESAEWDGICGSDDDGSIDMQLIECNSPSFSPRWKSSISPASLAAEGKFHSVVDSHEAAGRNQKVSIDTSTEESIFRNSSAWNSSPEATDQSWYSDAIEALHNMKEIHMSMELCPLSFEENTPAVNQHQLLDVRPMDGCSPEKKVKKRAFSWYVSESDVQRNYHRYGEEGVQDDSELYHMGDERTQHSSLVMNGVQHRRSALKLCSNFQRDFRRGDEKSKYIKESCAELRRDPIPGLMQGVDKENIISRDQHTYLS